MGIQGLLPLLKSIQRPVHVREYAGMTLAVDGYCWLHKAAFGCAMELAMGGPAASMKYVDYCMSRVQLLISHGVRPYIVFDGGPLPMKAHTESDRKSRREECMDRAKQYLREGNRSKAVEYFQQCVDISPEHAYHWIKALRTSNVPYVVAPYEADAQLAYLERNGLVDGIITEDSDLLVFGCKRVIYKMDRAGLATEIHADRLAAVDEVNFRDWSMAKFRHMCILSGCDYLPNIPGLGLRTAYKLLKQHRTVENTLKALRRDQSHYIPHDYSERFRLADMTFLHQRVFDPVQRKLVHLTPFLYDGDTSGVDGSELLNFVGPDLDDCVAQNIADGNWDPITMRPFVEVARASSVEPLFARRQSAPPALTATSHCVSTSNDSIEKITPEDILLRQIQVYPATAPLSHYAQRRAIHKMTLPPANPFQLRRCRSSQQQLITAFTVATSSDFQKMKSEDGENDDDVNTAMRLSRPSDTPDNVNAYVTPTLRQESTKLRVIRTSKFFIGRHKSKAPQALSVQMGTEHVVAPDHDVPAALCDGDEAPVPKTAIASTVLSHTSANISKNRQSNRTLLPSANAGVHGRLKLDRFKSQLMK